MEVSTTQPSNSPADVSLPAWLSDKRMKVLWIGIYFVLAVLCFCVFVPIAMTKENSVGNCLLYADTLGFGGSSVCGYCIAIPVIFLIMCCTRGIYLILEMTKYSSKLPTKLISSIFAKAAGLVLDLVMLLLLLVVAAMISAGFSHLCGSLFDGRSECDSKHGIGLYPSGEKNDSFYNQLAVAEGSAWFTWVLWLIVVISKCLIFWKDGSLEQTLKSSKWSMVRKNPPEVEKY